MAKYKSIIITKAGLELIAAMQSSGGTIEFTAIKTGNGVYDDIEILSELTGLKAVKQIFGITAIIRDETVIKVRSIISNNNLNEGYNITEIGLFAKDESDNEILYAIAVAEVGLEDYIPAYADAPTTITNEMYIDVSNIEGDVKFQATVIEGTYVTVQDYNDHIADSKKHVSDNERETWNNKVNKDEIIVENLIPYPYYNKTSVTVDGITWTDNGDGTITANGTAERLTGFACRLREGVTDNAPLMLKPGTYTLSGCPKSKNSDYYIVAKHTINGANIIIAQDYGEGCTFSVSEEKQTELKIGIVAGATVDNVTFKPMIESGAVAHPWQPYNLSRKKMREDIDNKRLANNLATTEEGFALDARQGKILADQIAEVKSVAVKVFTKKITKGEKYKIGAINGNTLFNGYIGLITEGNLSKHNSPVFDTSPYVLQVSDSHVSLYSSVTSGLIIEVFTADTNVIVMSDRDIRFTLID